MKSELKVKFLQFLLNKKKDANEGFTLIELLVVVIIIGVLAAVALPNLLGQVGKAREAEAKNILGALNRAQQNYFAQTSKFVAADADFDKLEVPSKKGKYYTFSAKASGVILGANANNKNDGTRDYVGAVQYDQKSRAFDAVVCRSTDTDNFYAISDATKVVEENGSVEDMSKSGAVKCIDKTEEIK